MFKNLWGGDVTKNRDFIEGKWSHMASFSIFEIKVYKKFKNL